MGQESSLPVYWLLDLSVMLQRTFYSTHLLHHHHARVYLFAGLPVQALWFPLFGTHSLHRILYGRNPSFPPLKVPLQRLHQGPNQEFLMAQSQFQSYRRDPPRRRPQNCQFDQADFCSFWHYLLHHGRNRYLHVGLCPRKSFVYVYDLQYVLHRMLTV